MFEGNVLFALGLTVFAGLATGVGSLIGLYSRGFNQKVLCGTLGFSAGVMIYVSFIEIFVKARESLEANFGEKEAYVYTTLAFFAGIAIIALIDYLIPNSKNPHEFHQSKRFTEKPPEKEVVEYPETLSEVYLKKRRLFRMGVFSAIAIAIHNFPEGLATFMSALQDPQLGVTIAIAIAIHNIPEGLVVSVPVYYATKNRGLAFVLSLASGIAEPIGALFGYFLLSSFFNETTFGLVFASVAGIMVYISLDELLPTAQECGEHHIAIGGVIAGKMVMAASLLLA